MQYVSYKNKIEIQPIYELLKVCIRHNLSGNYQTKIN